MKKPDKRNSYDRMEWAGAFGDIGTLIPFIIGYIVLVGMDPLGLLLGFGISMLAVGFSYRRPMPVQPMKAIGAAAIANPAAYGPNLIWGAGLFTGAFWLIIGVTGTIDRITRIVTRPVVLGILLGLGMNFALQGTRMMFGNGAGLSIISQPESALISGWQGTLLAVVSLLTALLLLNNHRLPAMFALLTLGSVVGAVNAVSDPVLSAQLSSVSIDFRLPEFGLGDFSISDLLEGAVFLALAQIPLTLGNAIIAVTEEHNSVFPDTPVTEKKVTISQGIMNLLAPIIGGAPMCHGAGGFASHIRYGARTGGALVILGSIMVLLALFLSESVAIILGIFPMQVLGVILLFAGIELASSVRNCGREKADIFVMLFTAGLAMWNMGWAFLAGLALYYLIHWRIVRP